MTSPLAATSKSIPPATHHRKPTSERTITLKIGDISFKVNLIKFGSTRSSLKILGGPIGGFQTAVHKRKGSGPKTAFNQCHAEIERELKTRTVLAETQKRVVEKLRSDKPIDPKIKARVENEVDRLISEVRASHSSAPAESCDKPDDLLSDFVMI